MQILFTPIQITDKDKVLNLFKEAADKIFRMGIDHWQYWKNPPPDKIHWVEQGILNGEFFFTQNEGGETLGMVRVLQEDILYWGKQEEKAVYVHSLVVREQFEGHGFGKWCFKKSNMMQKTIIVDMSGWMQIQKILNYAHITKI